MIIKKWSPLDSFYSFSEKRGNRAGGNPRVLELFFDGVCGPRFEIPTHLRIFIPQNTADLTGFVCLFVLFCFVWFFCLFLFVLFCFLFVCLFVCFLKFSQNQVPFLTALKTAAFIIIFAIFMKCDTFSRIFFFLTKMWPMSTKGFLVKK